MTVIDAHLHVWDLQRSGYPWLTGDHGALHRDVTPEEAADRLREAGISHALLVQADDTTAETCYLLDVALAHPFVWGVVGWVALDDPARVGAQLDGFEAHAPGVLRGVRHLVHDDARADFLRLPEVRRSLGEVARRGLAFDVPDAWPAHLDQTAELAVAVPELTIVLDHLGKPPRSGARGEMVAWEQQLRAVAAHPTTRAKVSGLQVAGQPFTADALRPVLHVALDAFGAERLMYGGDWPMTLTCGDYQHHWAVVRELLDELSPAEQDHILAHTARTTYGGGR